MSKVQRIKCGNVNCYIVSEGASGILVDTGRKEDLDTVIWISFFQLELESENW
jgi:hydroxyacylglutathione hydrolase